MFSSTTEGVCCSGEMLSFIIFSLCEISCNRISYLSFHTLCKAKDTKLSKLMSDTGSQSSESSQMSVLESEIHFLKTDADTLKEVLLTKSKELEMSKV
jgi:hypothetical protein